MRPTTQRQRGAALIITVGLLAVLAVVGFGFAVLARLHHDVSRSYRASSQNDLIAHAALQYAIGEIRYGWGHAPLNAAAGYRTYQVGAVANPTEGPTSTWFVDPTIASQGYTGTDAKKHYCNLRGNSYALVHDDLGSRVGVSNVKVLDAAGKLNINDREDASYARVKAILEHVLTELRLDTSLAAADIFTYRDTLPDKRFSTLEQLVARNSDGTYKISGMNARVFELLKHYVTIYSWPHRLPVASGFPYVVRPTGTALSRSDSDTSTTPKKYYYRSPININTASKELLYALLRVALAADGTLLDATEARNVALWMVRKRDPESTDNWPAGAISGTGSAEWKAWLPPPTGSDAAPYKYDQYLERKFEAWRNYPLGQFDDWNELIDFVYSLAPRSTAYPHDGGNPSDPFLDTAVLTGSAEKKAELIIAALSPNAFAAGLAGYNSWQLGYSRLKKDSTQATFREQVIRDRDYTAAAPYTDAAPMPQVTGGHQVAANGYSYPLCFSSLGRYEIYTRTYTFVKAEQGYATTSTLPESTLTDSGKTWLASPSQWRGYSVLIYAGMGKGQMRSIVYIKPDITATTGRTLVVDRWSTPLDTTSDPNAVNSTRSRYYIVSPGAFHDRPPAAAITTPPNDPPTNIRSHLVQDTDAAWEDDQWNGHRVVVYRSTFNAATNTETIDDASIQERTIIDTDKATKSLILAPDLDLSLLTQQTYTAYMILGCDGVVEHNGAFKAYDVIRHTTQDDFDPSAGTRPAAVSDAAQYTYAATGPHNYRKANGATVGGAVLPSKVDGFITARRKAVTAPGSVTNPLIHSFDKADLSPDAGGSLVTSVPAAADIVKDAFSTTTGRFLSDGIHLTGGAAHYLDYSMTSNLSTNDRNEGGFVSFWFRPDEAFFTNPHTIVKISGATGEEISLQALTSGSDRILQLSVTGTPRVYEGTFIDGEHKPTKPAAPDVVYKAGTSTYTDATYAKTTAWKPGEWHHIAFAWHECANDTENHNNDPAYNTDGNIATDWRDDDTTGAGGKCNYILDNEVACRLRIWVDGNSSAVTKAANEKPAFNFYPPAGGAAAIRLSGDAAGTLDGLIVGKHTDNQLNFTLTPVPDRYDCLGAAASAKYAEYQSPPITIPNPGGDTITLGTVAWTGFLPWIRKMGATNERWGGATGSTAKFPIRLQAGLGTKWSKDVPEKDGPMDDPKFGGQPVMGGAPLVDTSRNRIEDSTTGDIILQYRVYLHPGHGSDAGDSLPGLLKGRQSPTVEDITITYLGPVVFYFWQ